MCKIAQKISEFLDFLEVYYILFMHQLYYILRSTLTEATFTVKFISTVYDECIFCCTQNITMYW